MIWSRIPLFKSVITRLIIPTKCTIECHNLHGTKLRRLPQFHKIYALRCQVAENNPYKYYNSRSRNC